MKSTRKIGSSCSNDLIFGIFVLGIMRINSLWEFHIREI